MKKLILFTAFLSLFITTGIAQTSKIPSLLNMVAVVRDSVTHLPIANTKINVRLIIYTGGVETYCVLRTDVPTNSYGEISIEWGIPTNNTNNFACKGSTLLDANWQNGSTSYSLYWTTSSTANYFKVDSGAFAAVPYAFASRTAEQLVMPGKTDGDLLTWNGSTSSWVAVQPSVQDFAVFSDHQSYKTDEITPAKASWQKRILNTVESSSGSSITLDVSTSKITLQPGRYSINATIPSKDVDHFTTRFYNGTNAVIAGTNAQSATATHACDYSFINGIVTIIAKTNFVIEETCETVGYFGFNGSQYSGATGLEEVYTRVVIQKLK